MMRTGRVGQAWADALRGAESNAAPASRERRDAICLSSRILAARLRTGRDGRQAGLRAARAGRHAARAMYNPPAFRETDTATLHGLIRAGRLAIMLSPGADGGLPDATHLPLLLDAEAGPLGT